MDFNDYVYTEEQEAFRREVQAWIAEHRPPGVHLPVTWVFSLGMGTRSRDRASREYLDLAREIRRELGRKGWLAPTFPREYGGGGLSGDHEVILEEELERSRLPIHFNNPWVQSTLLVWGSDDQKQKFLKPLLDGELIAYQAFTEPQSGTDLANIKCTAVRDGDDWVINGTKCFASGPGPDRCDLLYGPILTDPAAPRHHNLGYFIIPAKSPGVTIVPMELLEGPHHTNMVYYDNVRIPADSLVGGDHQGWQVTQTSLEEEHGGRGKPMRMDVQVQLDFDYLRSTTRGGVLLGADPHIADQAVLNYIDDHIHGLLAVRNFSMFAARQEMTYEGSQVNAWDKLTEMANYIRRREIYGPYVQVEYPDPRSPFAQAPNNVARATPPHAGGTLEIQKQIIARRLGMSRTQERAAITPASAPAPART